MIEEIIKPQDSLPFSEPKQQAILGYALQNDKFFAQVRTRIQPEWFYDKYAGQIFAAKVAFFKRWGRNPRPAELLEVQEFQHEDPKEKNKLRDMIKLAEHQTMAYGVDVLIGELSDWYKSRIYHQAVHESARLYNAKKPEAAYVCVDKAVKEIKEGNFQLHDCEIFDDYEREFDQSRVELSNALTFGIDLFDKLLTPEATEGSLLRGDTTVLLAPTNVGKTTCMITVAKWNILREKQILFISHEGRPTDIKKKIWMSILNTSYQGLLNMYKSTEGKVIMENALRWIDAHLTYVPLNKAGLTIEDVEPVIRYHQEKKMSQNNGRGFDLLIDDYPAKLSTKQASGGHMPRRVIDEHIYNYFVQFALEYNFHSLLAIQTNREGSKVNKREHGEERLLRMEDVMESWGVMTAATNVITLNRDPRAERQNRISYHICKSRSSETGWTVVCRSNFGHAITHGNSDAQHQLGGTAYRGDTSMPDKVDDLLDEYPNQAVPEGVV